MQSYSTPVKFCRITIKAKGNCFFTKFKISQFAKRNVPYQLIPTALRISRQSTSGHVFLVVSETNITFQIDQDRYMFSYRIPMDMIVEENEIFRVELLYPRGGVIGAIGEATIIAQNDDSK